jgi:hypothetical protein
MRSRPLALFLLTVIAIVAGPRKNVATAKGENEELALTVTIYGDAAAVKELLNNDLGGNYVVAEVKAEPKYGKEVSISRDDFLLLNSDDGDKSLPFVASQVAGRSAIIVSRTPGQGGGGASTSPTYGGMQVPIGGMGYPSDGGMIGAGGGADTSGVKATMKISDDTSENPLEKLLDARILPEKKTEQPVSGLLYFVLDKHKMKDLELRYGNKERRITLRFKP